MAQKKAAKQEPTELMVVNDSPGEECRVAILQDNHLEELYTERLATATNVGNIYKGRVTNVEPAIQAAFVDYGEGQSGFLHISDLHPKYFSSGGEDRTERVGMKIPRRQRPPIQDALRRGREILVQVMKEGIGTKGPTLTSYISIPGRLVVMMPDMDRIGVSRKVEDEQRRREMRQVLDSLDLPDKFGFILRTAGFGANKTDLKRDVAYLTRLWKAMEKRMGMSGAPFPLYTETDLLIRTIRDVLRPTIRAIIVDSESAYERASAFLRVVAPRSAPKILRYNRPAPIFHAFDVERQIDLIHSREVPLPSGGALVIDQTEALVAIDVNSGKSRSASDAETNAYRTNCEAVDEIARQLRLRDLGGLVVNDLIDMRAQKHRRLIEERFRNNLKSDRARSTTLRISDFGIIEMTRQRMRPGIGKANFVECPHCHGRGEVKAPDYLGSFAARHAGYLLQYPQVERVEIVCSPHVASFLLSHRRRQLVELEDATGKSIDVRVSDAIAADRVDFYAYDPRNADIAIEKLPTVPAPTLEKLERSMPTTAPADAASPAPEVETVETGPEIEEEEEAEARPAGRRRRRRRRGGEPAVAAPARLEPVAAMDLLEVDEEPEEEEAPASVRRKKNRRSKRRRRGRGGATETAATVQSAEPDETATGAAEPVPAEAAAEAGEQAPETTAAEEGAGRRRRRRPAAAKSVRVHVLAKQLGISSKVLIERCREQSIEVKNHMSSVGPDDVAKLQSEGPPTPAPASGPSSEPSSDAGDERAADSGRTGRRRRRRRRSGKREPDGEATPVAGDDDTVPAEPEITTVVSGASEPDDAPRSKTRRKRRRRSGAARAEVSAPVAATVAANGQEIPPVEKPAKKRPRRLLYNRRSSISPSARDASRDE